jgi:hypothetical protein
VSTGHLAPQEPGSDVAARWSRAVELVARDRGHRIHRFEPDYVVIDGAHRRRMAFAGLLGTSVTRPAVVLTEDISLVRAHLGVLGLPCVRCRAQPREQDPPAWSSVTPLGPDLRVRRATPATPATDAVDVGRHVADAHRFLAAWTEMSLRVDDDAQLRVLAEPDVEAEEYEVYVVGGRTLIGYARDRHVGVDPAPRPAMTVVPVPTEVSELAIRAIDAMPGTSYGTVRIQVPLRDGSPSAPRIHTVELSPPPAVSTSPELLRMVATAVLEQETGTSVRREAWTTRLRRRLRRG